MEISEIELKQIRLAVLVPMTKALLEDFGTPPELNVGVDMVTDNITFSARFMVYGQEHTRLLVEWPATWWDHFRKDHFPDWANRRWPPEMVQKTMIARALYPQLPKKLPDGTRRLDVLTLEPGDLTGA